MDPVEEDFPFVQVKGPPRRTSGEVIQDFNGDIDGGGYKFSMDDPAKPPMALVSPTFTEGVARVLGKGAEKYAKGNWMRGMSFDEVMSAIERHLNALKRGEDIDPDSGEGHIFHLGCGAMFLAEFLHGPRAVEYSQFDDRGMKALMQGAS